MGWVEVQARIARDPHVVFALLVAHEHVHAWRPSVVRMELLTPQPLRVGSHLEETRIVLGRPRTLRFEVLALDAPLRRLVLRSSGAGEVVLTVEPAREGALVTYRIDQGRGLVARLLAPLKRPLVRARMRAELCALREHLERGRAGERSPV